MTLSAGTRLGPYEVLSPLGAGGMGEVYRARDTRLDRLVAVKVLPQHLAKDGDALARFEREAKAVAALNHPNILGVHDFATQGDTSYVVMELLEGESLRARLERGPLAPRKATELATQMAEGLAAAHEKGVVHRDLKPENLWITKEGRLKILDFGLAKQVGATGARSDSYAPTAAPSPGHKTENGMILGTLGYMSPEQVRGESVDARSDIFSFGVVLYEMLTARRAFARDSAGDTLAAILRDDPPEMEGASKPIPPGLQQIVSHCLEKEPAHRFRDAHDLAFALGNITDGVSPVTAPRNRRTILLWAALAVIPILAAVLTGLVYQRVSSPPPSFKRLTFFRGTLDRAAFANHGQTILYSAQVNGQPSSLYSLSKGAAEPIQLGPPGTHLLSVSAGNDLLVLRNARIWAEGNQGTLAQTTQAGTGLREIAERVIMADWAPDGQTYAVERFSNANATTTQTTQIDFPFGKVAYQSAGRLTNLRVSPDGRHLLFLEHTIAPGAPVHLQILGMDGRVETLARGPQVDSAIWGPFGREIWLAEQEGDQTTLSKIALSGSRKTLWRGAGSFELQGVDEDGRLLVSLQRVEDQVETAGEDSVFPRNLSWLNSTYAAGFSRDGRTLLFTESNTGGASLDGIYLRRAGEPAPVRLGSGTGCDISPDARTVLGLRPDGQYQLIPTGAGSTRNLDTGPGTGGAGWFFPDGRRILLDKVLPNGVSQMVICDLEQVSIRPAAPENFTCFTGQRPLSPDGTRMALYATDTKTSEVTFWIFPVGGGERTPLKGILPKEVLQAWTEDGKGLYVFERGTVPTQIVRVDVITGRREPWNVFVPADPAGIRGITNFEITRDAKRVAFNYKRVLSQLFLVEGLK